MLHAITHNVNKIPQCVLKVIDLSLSSASQTEEENKNKSGIGGSQQKEGKLEVTESEEIQHWKIRQDWRKKHFYWLSTGLK